MCDNIKFFYYYCLCAAGNYIAIAKALDVSSSVIAAGLAADSVICAFYFMTLFALASKIPAESLPPQTSGKMVMIYT